MRAPRIVESLEGNFFRYKANNNTSWYILFDQKEHKFLINHITNNHSQDFPYLL